MVRAADDIDAPSGFAEFAPVSSKISTASHGRVPAQADVSVLRADLADRLGNLCNGLNVRDAVSGLAFVRWSRDREDDWYTCDVALEVLPGELVGVGDAIVLESWPVACAQIGRDHLMLRNSRMPIEKNPWAVRVRSPSGGASDGVFYVFVGRHGIETVSGAKLLLNLSGGWPQPPLCTPPTPPVFYIAKKKPAQFSKPDEASQQRKARQKASHHS